LRARRHDSQARNADLQEFDGRLEVRPHVEGQQDRELLRHRAHVFHARCGEVFRRALEAGQVVAQDGSVLADDVPEVRRADGAEKVGLGFEVGCREAEQLCGFVVVEGEGFWGGDEFRAE
jgi:hypothetical protein